MTYSTAETEVAKQLVDSSDGYIRLLLRSHNRRNGTDALDLRTYYIECEINEGLDLTIELSHKAIVDDNGDVIWVKNLTQGKQLRRPIEYTVSSDRRSVTVGAIYAALDSVAYFNGGDVLDGGTGDVCISAWIRRDGAPINEYLVQKYDGLTGYILNLDSSGRFKTGIVDTGGTVSSTTGFSVCDNLWHHVAVIFDRSGNMTRYVDGVAYGDANDITAISGDISGGSDFTIGATRIGTLGLNGDIRDVRVLLGSLWSASEISTQFSNPLDSSVGGINTSSWYFTDAASATLVNDGTGPNNLTLNGGDTTNYGTHSRAELTAAGNEVEVKYNRYFEVMFASIPEEWFTGAPSSGERARSTEVVLQTLSESK